MDWIVATARDCGLEREGAGGDVVRGLEPPSEDMSVVVSGRDDESRSREGGWELSVEERGVRSDLAEQGVLEGGLPSGSLESERMWSRMSTDRGIPNAWRISLNM
jgi:hypothetical protein